MNRREPITTAEIFVRAPDGGTHGPIPCVISESRQTITFVEDCLVFTTADRILRPLASGEIETYAIVDARFWPRDKELPGKWELSVEKEREGEADQGTVSHRAVLKQCYGVAGKRQAQIVIHAVRFLRRAIQESEAPLEEQEEAQRRLSAVFAHPVVAIALGETVKVLI